MTNVIFKVGLNSRKYMLYLREGKSRSQKATINYQHLKMHNDIGKPIFGIYESISTHIFEERSKMKL